MIDKKIYIKQRLKDIEERSHILKGEEMSESENNIYLRHIIHMNDGYEEFPTLCGGILGDTQNTDPEKVNCKKCVRFMKDSKRFAISRKLRKDRIEKMEKKG